MIRPAGSAPAPRHARRAALLAGCTAFAVYLATCGGSLATSDALMTFDLTRSLVQHGSVAVSRDVLGWAHNRGVDGRFYSQFGIGQAVYNVPFYVAGAWVEQAVGRPIGRPDTVTKAAVAAGSAVAAALVVWLAFLFAYQLTNQLAAATYAAAALGVGTLLWPYAKFGYNQPLAAWCLLAANYAVWRGAVTNRAAWLALGGLGLGAGLLTRHETALAAVPCVLLLIAASRRDVRLLARRLFFVGVPAAAGVLVWMLYNQARFGSPFDSGYTPGFGSIREGAWGLLFSPGASLFLYSPIVAFGLVALVRMGRRHGLVAGLFGAHVVLYLVFYASLADWEGGRSYGGRYLVPLLPYFCIPLACWFSDARRATRIALAAALVSSILVQAPGVLMDFAKVAEQDAQRTGESHVNRHASWRSASLMLNARAAARALPEHLSYLLAGAPPEWVRSAGGSEDRSFSRQFAFSLDLWWLYLFHLRVVSSATAAALGALSWATAIAFGAALGRALHHEARRR